MEYLAKFTPDRKAGGYVVTFPDVAGAVTEGDTLEEAKAMAAEALELALTFYIDRGAELPVARAKPGRFMHLIRVSAAVDTKLQLYSAWLSSGIRKAEFARRIGISKTNIDRLFDISHETRLEQLEAAFLALGLKVVIQVRAA